MTSPEQPIPSRENSKLSKSQEASAIIIKIMQQILSYLCRGTGSREKGIAIETRKSLTPAVLDAGVNEEAASNGDGHFPVNAL